MSESPPDGAATEETAEGQKPKKGKKAVLIAALLGLGGGAAGGLVVLGPAIGTSMAASAPLPGAEAAADDGHGGGGDDGHGGGGAEGGGGADALHVIDNLVVNPSDSEGTRFLLASVALVPGDPGLGDELTARDVELRDALIRVLGGKTVDQLVDIGQRAALADELKAAVESIVGDHTIRRLFIPQYVIQ